MAEKEDYQKFICLASRKKGSVIQTRVYRASCPTINIQKINSRKQTNWVLELIIGPLSSGTTEARIRLRKERGGIYKQTSLAIQLAKAFASRLSLDWTQLIYRNPTEGVLFSVLRKVEVAGGRTS